MTTAGALAAGLRTDDELAVAHDLMHRLAKRAIALEGTCEWSSFFCFLSYSKTELTGDGE